MITISHASLTDKRKAYESLYLSDTTPMHCGLPYYPENPVIDWEQFQEGFEDFYFQEEGREKGSVMVVEKDGKTIGYTCYACFHLHPQMAELDIWLASKSYCGKGFGTAALKETIHYLFTHLGITKFIIRPSVKNIFAIKAYEKCGFKHAKDKRSTVEKFIKEEYHDEYRDGDYGFDSTAVLTLEL